jgi:tryptophan synthase beta chain
MKSEADERGRFGRFGGRYVPETLIAALDELTEAYPRITAQPDFREELSGLLDSYAGPAHHGAAGLPGGAQRVAR